MASGIKKFEFHLNNLESLLETANSSTDPGLTFYSNDGRTPLFMLEGLSRLYANLHNKTKFTQLKELFKLFEDLLGAIDYFDVYTKHYKDKSNVPDSIKDYMEKNRLLGIDKLNQNLASKGWIGKNQNPFKDVRKTLSEIDWLDSKDEVKEIKKIYESEIETVCKFIKKYGQPFTEMENHVHELRRDIRWLSIFTHALRGQIQFAYRTGSEKKFSKFLTPEILNSKFNQMPEIGDNKQALLLERNAFFALSWLIAEIGNIKDEGLEYYALQEAFRHSEKLDDQEAGKKALEILGWEEGKTSELLKISSKLANDFIEEKVLEDLIFGIVKF